MFFIKECPQAFCVQNLASIGTIVCARRTCSQRALYVRDRSQKLAMITQHAIQKESYQLLLCCEWPMRGRAIVYVCKRDYTLTHSLEKERTCNVVELSLSAFKFVSFN
jgi:hypothetical protein